MYNVPIDYFVISETRLNNSFPYVQLTINNYEIRARRDRDKHEGSLIGVNKHRSNMLRSNHLKQKLGHL